MTALQALNGRWPGVTVNVGTIRGGTRPNVVPAECALEVDVRAVTRSSLEAVEAEIRAHRPAGDLRRHHDRRRRAGPPLADGEARALGAARRARGGARRRLGFELRDAATGGASDANTTAGMGVPTIDGLGPIGGYDHSPDEYLELDSIVPRTTLLAALIAAIGRDPEVRAWRAEREARAADVESLA